MLKIIVIILVAMALEAVGVVFLSKGLKQVGAIEKVSVAEVWRFASGTVTNRNVLIGIFFEALFFGALLFLLSKSDVSFIWPLTALGFVFTTLSAKFLLHEEVSPARWAGVVMIMMGAAMITWSEQTKRASLESAGNVLHEPLKQKPH
jgi:uncharacterized membrane protein